MTATVVHTINTAEDANKKAVHDDMISPRFYTTDFAAMDRISVEPVRAEWDRMMAEYEGDNNHDHFQRDEASSQAKWLRAWPASRPRCARNSWTFW